MAIELIDTVRPKNGQPFPIVLSEDIRGGLHYASTIEIMNEIPMERREKGMLCYVDMLGFYQLDEDLTRWKLLGKLDENTIKVFEDLNEIEDPKVGQIAFISGNESGMFFYDGTEWQNFSSAEYNQTFSTEQELINSQNNSPLGSFSYVEETDTIYFLSSNDGWTKLTTTLFLENQLELKANKVHEHTYEELVDAIPKEELATKEHVSQKISEMVDSAPESLDTLKKLSDALNNDENFATTTLTMISEKADKEHSHDEYLTEDALENEVIFDVEMNTVSALGGIKAGENLNGLSVKQILNKLLFPYVAPTCTAKINYTPSGTLFEKGTTIQITSMSCTVTRKSEEIKEITFLDSSTILQEISNAPNGGTFTFTFAEPLSITSNIANTRFRASTTDSTGKVIYGNTAAISFCYPYYFGVISDNINIDSNLITGLTKKVEAKGDKTFKYTTNNNRMVIAYPKSYGTLKRILDANSFDVTNTFSVNELAVVGLDGTAQVYYVYVNNASTVSDFEMKFYF